MSTVLTLPRLGETMEEGRVVVWLVEPGSAYRRGDAILEVETDKTVVEVPALEDGVIAEILAPEGAQVQVGDPIARLVGGEASDVARTEPAAAPAEPAPKPERPKPTPPAPQTQGVRATPLARRLARQRGLDIAQIKGTGRRNRVERDDVLRAAGAQPQTGATGIAYTLTGPESGQPVLLLHGFGGDRTLWAGLSAGLTRAGRRVLAPDLPGHGETQIYAKAPEALSQGLADLMHQTLDVPAHVVAHSMGAVPAVALAEAGAVRSLTLIAPVGVGLRIDDTFIHGLAGAKTSGEVAHLLQRTMEMPLPLSSDALDRIAEATSEGRLKDLAATLVGASGQSVSLRAPLARLADSIPIRIVAPHRDRILEWSGMVTVSPRIAVHHLPRAGHMAMWDAAPELLDILRDATES